MKRIAAVIVGLAFAAAIGVSALGCGDGIGATDQPELRVETEQLEVPMAPHDRAQTTDPRDLTLRNTGPGDLEIQSMEWIEKPDRVEAVHQGELYDEDRACDSDEDCAPDGVCTLGGRCIDIGFRDLSDGIGQEHTFDQRIFVTAGDDVVDCPDPSDAEEAPDGYCGEIRIETNAPNDLGFGEDGTAHVYLVAEDASGLLVVPSEYNFLEFTHAEPGTTQTKEFELRNDASEPLEIQAAHFQQNPGWFEISPSMFGTEIEGNQSRTFTIELTPSESATEEALNFQTSLSFDSSSVSFEPAITIEVTDGPGDIPMLEVEPTQLSFENGEPKTLQVQNHGAGLLRLFGMEVRPDAVSEHYSVTYGGQDVVDGSDIFPLSITPADGEEPTVEEFEVELTNPGAETTVGELRINHNDDRHDNFTEVGLLGDAADIAVGEMQPSRVRFRSDAGGDVQQRLMAVENTGTEPLEITDVHFDERNPNTDAADYEVDGLVTTVAPGDIEEATISYTGTAPATEEDLRVYVDSNHAGAAEAMEFLVTGTDQTEPTMDISIDPSFTTDAAVGETATFEVEDTTGQAETSLASWYLHQRPADSNATLTGSGVEASLEVDAAGSYRISVVVRDGDNREVQEVFDFQAVD